MSSPQNVLKGGCPLGHDKPKPAETTQQAAPKAGACTSDGCPVDHSSYKHPVAYNVYGQVIDPTNQMPPPQQDPWPGQKVPLPKERVQSNIRKGGTESTWLYPSEQMFFNALKRKGKGDDVSEEDVKVIVAIHNGMNEKTWSNVMDWEKMHASHCADPTLLKFRGRPDELSPKARFMSWFGHPTPFDRHDWVIDRCGTQVRYIIDFYYKPVADDSQAVSLKNGFLHTQNITVDVRPALDSFGAVFDRVKFQFRKLWSFNSSA
eukprot:GILK01004634.1.p1 GENE.GILK01004634.1~~GILK01004634.1.p1  ORF type:complete len:262 (+),score=30.70 GILK01004634.1:63-848(+)